MLFTSAFSSGKSTCNTNFTFLVAGFSVSFTDASTSTNAISSWQWDFGDGSTSTAQNPSHTYSIADTFHVCLTINDNHGCSDTWCHSVIVTVVNPCHANFTFHATGLDVSFTDASIAGGAITSWQWDFGDGSTSTLQNPQHTYATGDTFHVCLTIHDSHGCSDTHCHDVIVTSVHPCHASFTFGVDSTGTVIYFMNTSSGTTGTTTYNWDFGDGSTSTLENPTYTYTHTGYHVVCLYINDSTTGCSSHFCHVVFHGHVHHHHAALSSARVSDSPDDMISISIYPNPVQSSATVAYSLLESADVNIQIYDMLGSIVYEQGLWNESEGQHSHEVNVSELAKGIYILKLNTNSESVIKKITITNN